MNHFTKKWPLLTLFMAWFFMAFVQAQTLTPSPSIPINRPRVVVITSDNGGGHNAAAEAVEKSLGTDYEVIKLNLLKDKLGQLDKKFMDYFAQEKWTILRLMA